MGPSYWSGRDLPERADLVIVGAGFAGLATALSCLAARPGLSVVVIDRRQAGHGASGRNAGMVIPFPLIPLWLMRGSIRGDDPAEVNRLLVRELEAMLAGEIGDLVDRRAAEIVVAAKGWFWTQGLRWVGQRAAAAGQGLKRLSAGELRERYASTAGFGLAYPGHGIQPFAAVQRLRGAVEAAGGRLAEGVDVTAIRSERSEVAVVTDGGEILAKKVLFAGNAYGQTVAGVPKLGTIVHSYVLATGPLDAPQIAALGGETALVTELDTGIYRRVQEGRLIFGALDRLGLPVTAASAQLPRASAQLRALLARELGHLGLPPIEREWGGAFCQRAGAPLIAPSPDIAGLFFNTGYGGSGVALTLLSGRLAAGMLFPEADTADAARLRAAYANTRLPLAGLARVMFEAATAR